LIAIILIAASPDGEVAGMVGIRQRQNGHPCPDFSQQRLRMSVHAGPFVPWVKPKVCRQMGFLP
jgi:hypothetical protein